MEDVKLPRPEPRLIEISRKTTAKGSASSLIVDRPPEPGDRLACCQSCGRSSYSHPILPFFKARPEKEEDLFYCGCQGWD